MSTAVAHSHGVPTNITSGTRSTDPADFPPISALQEAWRFTPVGQLSVLEQPEFTNARVTVADVAGVTCADSTNAGVFVPSDRLAATTWARAAQAQVVDIAREQVPTDPIKVHVLLDDDLPAFARLVINAGAHSESKVEVTVTGAGSGGVIVELLLDAGAHLTLTMLTDLAATSVATVHVPAVLQRDAVLRSHTLTVSGGLVRVVPTVSYQGPGADAELSGAFIAGPGHHLEHRTLADHTVPNCRSYVAYKGVLGGDSLQPARTVWIGDVLIHAAATGTDTYELNRNLVLNDCARADSVPNLEIETGDIAGAGHASATGRLDDEQVFYLMSRGIDKTTATSLIVSGFFEDLLAAVPNEDMARRVRDRLAEVLA